MKPIMIAVDLQSMLPGGTNGGHKYFILDFLQFARGYSKQSLKFVFIIRREFSHEASSLFHPHEILLIRDNCKWPKAIEAVCSRITGKSVSNWLALRKLSKLKPDVIYCPFGIVTLELPGVPLIATIADLLNVDFQGTLTAEQIKHRDAYLAETTRKATLVHAISDYTANRLKEVYPIAKNKTFRAYHRTPFQGTEPCDASSTAMDKTALSKPFFYYPANYWTHKNHKKLLEAYHHYFVSTGDSAWDLVLTGDLLGKETEFDAMIGALNIATHVKHEGFVSAERVNQLWHSAGALVFPSLHEGFGLPLIEAMRYRVPIICGSLTCIGEIAGQAAHYVDVTDPRSIAEGLLAVSSDADLRSKLVEDGRRRFSEHFSGDKEISRLLENIVAVGKAKCTL